jgi:hypothetical protein
VKAVFLFIALILSKAISINHLQGYQPEKCPLSLISKAGVMVAKKKVSAVAASKVTVGNQEIPCGRAY